MFLVIRKHDIGCYECGGETTELVFATDKEELARSWVEAATAELEAARHALRERHTRPVDNSVVNSTNYMEWMKKIIQVDKERFDEENYSDVANVSYEAVEVEVR
jgi:hypothetical protein